MGESRGGEGRAEGPTTVQIAQALVPEYEGDARHVDSIKVDYVTEGLYAVEVALRGEAEREAFFLHVADAPPTEAAPIPSGDSADESSGAS